MADAKISALTALTGSNVVTANDVMVIVDDDVTTTKKITVAELIIALGSQMTTGDVKLTLKTSADTGWVMCDDGTIGNASSGGTTRANADTEDLFTLLWDNVDDAHAAVSTGRGASAAADFAANKTIALTKMLGRALAISGAGASLTSRALGLATGAETHALTAAEGPTHSHNVNAGGAGSTVSSNTRLSDRGADFNTKTITAAIQNSGSGSAHNNMQPSGFLNAMIKL